MVSFCFTTWLATRRLPVSRPWAKQFAWSNSFYVFICIIILKKVTNKTIGMCNFIFKNVIEDFSRVLNYNLTMYSFRAYTHKLPLSLQSFYIFNQFHEFFSSEKYKKNWSKCDLVSNRFKSQPCAVKRRGLLRISNPPLNMVKS